MPIATGRTEAQNQIEVENERVGIWEQRSNGETKKVLRVRLKTKEYF